MEDIFTCFFNALEPCWMPADMPADGPPDKKGDTFPFQKAAF